MNSQPIHIGILSTANIAMRSVIPAILELPQLFKIKGIASRDQSKADEAAKKIKVPSFGSYDALIQSPELQALYIPLPNALHFEWIKKALEQGLHVLSEKSLGCSLNEVTKLNEFAESKNLALVENFQFRFHSQLAFIKSLVAEGKIGELHCIRSSFGFPPFSDSNNIRYQKFLGGGALLDAGAYTLKISNLFLGDDIEVAASNLSYPDDSEVDITGGAYIKQKKGNLFLEAAFGFDNFYQCNIELWGSKGRIYTNRIFTAGPGFKPEVIVETNQGKETLTLEADNHFKNMLTHFHQLISGEKSKADEYKQNILQASLIEQVKQKAND